MHSLSNGGVASRRGIQVNKSKQDQSEDDTQYRIPSKFHLTNSSS